MATITHDDYCINICHGKCCRGCPNLTKEFKCGIHHQWKDGWCHFEAENMKAFPILELIDRGLLPKEVTAQCCYAHPYLLEES